jgi:hypothetical protein
MSSTHASVTLVAFDEPEDHLAEIGSRVVAGRLADAAHKVLALAAEDEDALAPFGFGAPWRKALEPKIAAVDEAKGGRTAAQSEARPSGRAVADELAKAFKWISRYGVVTKNAPTAVRDAAPHATAHDHSPKIVATEIESLAKFVSGHAKETEHFGGGAAFAKQGQAIAEELSGKRAAHHSDLARVSPAVRALHVAEGGLYLELVRLSRAAHDTLASERGKLYSLETIHPARHSHHATTPPVATTPATTA